jgi:putative inorganic carbon (HCO3(-)) transporter
MALTFNQVWRSLTLTNLPLAAWLQSSLLGQSIGLLSTWRRGSVLLQWGESLAAGLACLVFVLTPFVSDALAGVLLLLCGASWGLLTISDSRSGQHTTPIHFLVGLYWAIAAIATTFSPVTNAALEGLIKLTLYLFLFLLLARVMQNSHLRAWVIGTYLLTALIVSAYGIRQWFMCAEALATWVDPSSASAKATRVYSYLGNPNLLAGYLIPAVILSAAAIFAWQRWGCKLLALFMTGCNAACLILTYSRGGWIGFMFAALALALLLTYWFSITWPKFWQTWALPLAAGGLISFVIVAVLALEPLRARAMSIFAGRGDSSNNFRLNVWAAAIDMIKARPVLGIGPGNDAFNKIYPLFQRPRFTALSAYSIFLEIAIEVGFIGLACFFWLLATTLQSAWQSLYHLRQKQAAEGFWLLGAIAVIVGMLGHGLVDTVWYRPQISTLWWLMLALVTSYYRQHQSIQRSAKGSADPGLD